MDNLHFRHFRHLRPELPEWAGLRQQLYLAPLPRLRLGLRALPHSMPQAPPGSCELDAEVYSMLEDEGSPRRWVC